MITENEKQVFLKNNKGMMQETKVLTKKFTKRVFKKTKITQLFKPINYCEIVANTESN